MADWRFYSLDAMTLEIRDELALSDASGSDRLKGAGGAAGSIPLRHRHATRALLDTENTIIAAERDARLMWAHPLVAVDRGEGSDMLSLRCAGMWDMFRRIDLRNASHMTYGTLNSVEAEVRFEQVDQFRIVEDLIAHAVNTPGAALHTSVTWDTLSGVDRDRSYDLTGRMIGDLVEQLADVQNGFDWMLVPVGTVDDLSWELRLYSPRRQRLTSYEWSLDSHGSANLLGYSLTESSEQRVQRFVAVGAGEGADQLHAVAQDAALLGTLPLVVDSNAWSDVSRQATLQAHADRELAINRRAIRVLRLVTNPAVEPRLSTYTLGDVVRVKIDDGWAQVDGQYRIVAREMSIDADGAESVVVELDPIERGAV